MSRLKLKGAIELEDALDNLSALAGIEMSDPPPLGIVKGRRFVFDEAEFPKGTIKWWLSEEGADEVFSLVDGTYLAIYKYLRSLLESEEFDWEDEGEQKGLASLMVLVGESAHQLSQYLSYRLGKNFGKGIEGRESYRLLQEFYLDHIASQFQAQEGKSSEDRDFYLKDFEEIRRDLSYEFFYFRDEEGRPYFDAKTLKNVKLKVDFAEGEFEEDPFLKVQAMLDRDAHFSSMQILKECEAHLQLFFPLIRKHLANELVESLALAIYALYLASTPKNLLQNTEGKNSLEYFSDFHRFLRRCFKTNEYQRWLSYPPEQGEREILLFLALLYDLSEGFFRREGGVRQEVIGLIHRIVRKGEEEKKALEKHLLKGKELWVQLALDDENLRTYMGKFPQGPLFKTLDIIREAQDEEVWTAFDPLLQQNYPSKLYQVGKGVEILRLPCPTRQLMIQKAEVVEEFKGYLRFLKERKKKHLLINLQMRDSWQEKSRSKALEEMARSAEFQKEFSVITLPKGGAFYHQIEEYLSLSDAAAFLQLLKGSLESKDLGFYFPAPLHKGEFAKSFAKMPELIHKTFFEGKKSLSRREREDFIEIFYQFIIWKAIECLDVDEVSFTCKDAVDTGACQGALFFGMLQIFEGGFSKKAMVDMLRYLFYAPALLVRERAVDPERFGRALSALEQIELGFIASKSKLPKELY